MNATRTGLGTGILLASFLAAAGASSQIGAPACTDAGLDGIYAPWAEDAADAATATGAGDVSGHSIALGVRTQLSLKHRDEVVFVLPPEEPDMPAEYVYSGMVVFDVPEAGTYRIASVEGMWLDVVQDGALIASTAFGRGPECMGKFVEFPLQAGDAVLQLSGGPYETVDILIVPSR
jgi:hypothetical protein